MACLTDCIGDRPIGFYEGIVQVYKALTERPGIYGHLICLEDSGKFPDEWRGISKERERYLMHYYTSLLFCGVHKGGASKTTQVGWCNNMVADFVAMVRDLYAENKTFPYELTVCYLTRDSQEIAESMYGLQENKTIALEAFKDKAEHQADQFREAWEFGDVTLTYKKLCEDPIGSLKKLNPFYEPNESAVKNIMAKKIRV